MSQEQNRSNHPPNGDTRVTLAVLQREIVYRFEQVADRLDRLEEGQRELASDIKSRLDEQATAIETCERKLAILEATTIRLDVVKVSAVISMAVLVVMAAATVITKLAGFW